MAFKFETEAYDIIKTDGFYTIKTSRGDQTKAIANAAGVYADNFTTWSVKENPHHSQKGRVYFL